MSEEISPLRKVQKKGLGRGLGSLLGEAGSLESTTEKVSVTAAQNIQHAPIKTEVAALDEKLRIWNVAIENLTGNREQPRKTFDQAALIELSHSIKEKGILLPIVVRRVGEQKFEIIAGERRWRAAQMAGLKEVPVLIRTSENQEALELALIENIQRQNLNPVEEAEAYQRLIEKYGLTQQSVADKVGKDRATIANLLRLVALPPEIKNFVKAGEIALGQAKLLMSVADRELQLKLAKKVMHLRLSVRATERLIAKATAPAATSDILEIENIANHEREIRALTLELQKLFGTKVDVEIKNEKSRVAFQFYTVRELNQFVDRLRKSIR